MHTIITNGQTGFSVAPDPLITDTRCPKPTAVAMLVTPAQAAIFLQRLALERPIDEKRWLKYAGQLLGGAFVLSQDALAFEQGGEMVNGQHRCQASVATNVSFPSVVMFGVDADMRKVLDTPKPRTVGQTAQMYGHSNGNVLGGAAAFIFSYLKYGPHAAALERTQYRPSPTVLLDLIDHLDMQQACQVASKAGSIMPRSLVAACYYLCSRQKPELAAQFFAQAAKGEGLVSTHPAFQLREYFLRDRISQGRRVRGAKKPLRIVQAAHILKAWLLVLNNKRVKRLSWSFRESFPDLGEIDIPKDLRRFVQRTPSIPEIRKKVAAVGALPNFRREED